MATCRIYIRVSTDEQAEHGVSLQTQEEDCRTFASSQHWHIAGVYVDDGYSGKSLKRPAVQRLLAECQSGEVILFTRLDRLSRKQRDFVNLAADLQERGIFLRAVHEPIDTASDSGRVFSGIMSSMAEWERDRLRGRVTETTCKYVKLNHRRPGGRLPYGYKWGEGEAIPVLDPATVDHARRIFEWALSGESSRAICRRLHENGIPTQRGGRWTPRTVIKILTNPFYAGTLTWRRFSSGGKRQANNNQDYMTETGTHPTLLTPEQFDAIQEAMSLRKQMAPRQASAEFLLSGLLRCGICGAPMSGRTQKGRSHAWYLCGKAVDVANHPRFSFRTVPVELAVLAELQRLSNPDRIRAAYGTVADSIAEARTQTRTQILARIAQHQTALDTFEEDYGTGQLKIADYNRMKEKWNGRKAKAEQELAQLDAAPPIKSSSAIAQDMADLSMVWAVASPAERKQLLSCKIASITILPDPDTKRTRQTGTPFRLAITPLGLEAHNAQTNLPAVSNV